MSGGPHPLNKTTKTPLYLPPRQVITGPGELELDCGNCGSREFRAFVRARDDNQGQVSGLVCNGCDRFFRVNDAGVIEGGGKVTTRAATSAA